MRPNTMVMGLQIADRHCFLITHYFLLFCVTWCVIQTFIDTLLRTCSSCNTPHSMRKTANVNLWSSSQSFQFHLYHFAHPSTGLVS